VTLEKEISKTQNKNQRKERKNKKMNRKMTRNNFRELHTLLQYYIISDREIELRRWRRIALAIRLTVWIRGCRK